MYPVCVYLWNEEGTRNISGPGLVNGDVFFTRRTHYSALARRPVSVGHSYWGYWSNKWTRSRAWSPHCRIIILLCSHMRYRSPLHVHTPLVKGESKRPVVRVLFTFLCWISSSNVEWTWEISSWKAGWGWDFSMYIQQYGTNFDWNW